MYNYYVIEIQTNQDSSSNLVTGFNDRGTAEDAFCQAVMAANDSQVLIHTIMWIDNRGRNVEPPKSYTHPAPEPQNQEETEA